MNIIIGKTPTEMGELAAKAAAGLINKAIEQKGDARIVVSTGQSQFEFFESLLLQPIDWGKVEMFHLDEYIGIDENHPASFVKYLKERFTDKIPLKIAHFIYGDREAEKEIKRISELIAKSPVDAAFIGIGENAHIAFNDPPADFETDKPYIIVELNDTCKAQQVREGWFKTNDDVPKVAITMSPKQIMAAKAILSVVPHKVKAKAIADVVASKTTDNMIPATLLKTHPNWTLYLDEASASLIK